MSFFNDGYYKTSKGYALKNYGNSAFILFKNIKVDEDKYEVKYYPPLDRVLDESMFEEVATFETVLGVFKTAVEMAGTEIDLTTYDTKFLWEMIFTTNKDKCFLTSEKHENNNVSFKSDIKKLETFKFSPKLILDCLEDEYLFETVKIQFKQFKDKKAYIMVISFEKYDMYICSLVDS